MSSHWTGLHRDIDAAAKFSTINENRHFMPYLRTPNVHVSLHIHVHEEATSNMGVKEVYCNSKILGLYNHYPKMPYSLTIRMRVSNEKNPSLAEIFIKTQNSN